MSPRATLAALVVGAASACDEHADFNLRLRASARAARPEEPAGAPAVVARAPIAPAADVRGANQTLCACSCLPASGRALVTTRVD